MISSTFIAALANPIFFHPKVWLQSGLWVSAEWRDLVREGEHHLGILGSWGILPVPCSGPEKHEGFEGQEAR